MQWALSEDKDNKERNVDEPSDGEEALNCQFTDLIGMVLENFWNNKKKLECPENALERWGNCLQAL